MLAIAIILLCAALALGVLGLFADSMSDAPGQTSGVGPIVVGLFAVSALCFALWFGGWHLNLLTRS